MDIQGRVIMELPEEGGTSKAGNLWRRKGWVLETFGQYPRKVMFGAMNARIDQLHIEVGKVYTVSFDLESREFNGRWYTDVRAYAAVETAAPTPFGGEASYGAPAASAAPAAPAAQAPFQNPQQMQQPANPFDGGNETDDLPF